MRPHVIVSYKRGESKERDVYNYGVVGSMPISKLIGYITRVQAELAFRSPESNKEGACIIEYEPTTGIMTWSVDSCIPVDELVGSLELIKCQLVYSQMAAMTQEKQTGLVSANGRPILKEQSRGS